MANSDRLDRAAIEATYTTIRPHLRVTPVVEVPASHVAMVSHPVDVARLVQTAVDSCTGKA